MNYFIDFFKFREFCNFVTKIIIEKIQFGDMPRRIKLRPLKQPETRQLLYYLATTSALGGARLA